MKLKVTVWLLVLAGCASSLLAPRNLREADFVEKTKVKAGTAYTQALRWFDKNLRSVPGAVRVQDLESGRIQTHGAYQCNSFRRENEIKEYYLAFQLDFEAGPHFFNLHFTNLRMENDQGELVHKADAQLSDAANVARIEPCLKKMVAALAKAVESTTLTW